ncbi:MAG: hypothetical protein ACP5Q4_02365 [Candidatus Caldatribacteriaceae bacterium]
MTCYPWFERVTRKWWFYLIILLVQFLPPYPVKGITSSQDVNRLVEEILSRALVLSWRSLYPVFKIVPLLFLALLVFFPKSRPIFYLFVAFHYLIFAFFQNTAFLENRGFTMLTSNVVMITLVALSFFGEVFARKSASSFGRMDWKKVLVVGVAMFAFFYPVDPVSLQPRFRFEDLLTNAAGLTFCMMTPFYLMILLLTYPKVNLVTLRVTGLVGAIIGGYNVFLNFCFDFPHLWWNGVLHLPLLVISGYALRLSLKRD